MRTPAGRECDYFYGDYFRGRNVQECRLLKDNGETWSPELCETCPVPDIQRANACEHQKLTPKLVRKFPFIKRNVEVKAYCTKCTCKVKDPHIGCGQCHSFPDFLIGDIRDPDASS